MKLILPKLRQLISELRYEGGYPSLLTLERFRSFWSKCQGQRYVHTCPAWIDDLPCSEKEMGMGELSCPVKMNPSVILTENNNSPKPQCVPLCSTLILIALLIRFFTLTVGLLHHSHMISNMKDDV